MGVVLFIVALLGIGFYIGYRIGARFVRQENSSLYRQVHFLQNSNKYLSEEATGKYHLSGQVAQQQTSNLAATMHTVIQLLHSMQHSQAHTLNTEEQQKVNQLINQAKSITTSRP